ncbi:MAG: S-layer homology domain-containing protein, partial [Clostridia bacterium]|nr:S-layer homology domain-containing protein [Clostridia bacterium]
MKKIISMLLVCCISVSLLFVQGVAYAQDIYSDYYYDVLKALEIDVKNSDDDYITKGEFCEIIADLMCVDTDYDTSKLYFRDVSQSYKNYKAITALAEQGYIVGDDKGRFYPDESLTLDVAKVMLVRCLGYELNSQVIGGWLIGYNKIANSLDLGEGVGKVSAEGLTANQVNRLIYNALLTPTCELDLTDKVTQKGITLGEKLYNAVEINGIVNQTVFTGLDVVEGSLEGTALIGEQSVYTGEIKAENYLGYTVRAMAVEEDDEYTLIAIVKDERNSELVLDYTEIEEEVTTDRIKYLRAEDSRIKNADLDRNASVIYNYQKLNKFTADDLKINNGYMTLIDNDKDGEYDVIHVYEYKTYVVSGVETSTGEIYDKYGYDALETEENTIIMNSYGYKVDVSTIVEDSVLSVFLPKVKNDRSYTVIMVSGYEPVEGKVTSYQTDEDGIVTAKINGEEYIIDSRYLEVSSAQNSRFKKIQIGSSGIFLLNKDMLISGF